MFATDVKSRLLNCIEAWGNLSDLRSLVHAATLDNVILPLLRDATSSDQAKRNSARSNATTVGLKLYRSFSLIAAARESDTYRRTLVENLGESSETGDSLPHEELLKSIDQMLAAFEELGRSNSPENACSALLQAARANAEIASFNRGLRTALELISAMPSATEGDQGDQEFELVILIDATLPPETVGSMLIDFTSLYDALREYFGISSHRLRLLSIESGSVKIRLIGFKPLAKLLQPFLGWLFDRLREQSPSGRFDIANEQTKEVLETLSKAEKLGLKVPKRGRNDAEKMLETLTSLGLKAVQHAESLSVNGQAIGRHRSDVSGLLQHDHSEKHEPKLLEGPANDETTS